MTQKANCVFIDRLFFARCVTLAINRDGSSGGCCRLACITKDGVERKVYLNHELPKLG